MRASIIGVILVAGLAQPADFAVYANHRYGFSVTLPNTWKGFSVLQAQWTAVETEHPDRKQAGPLITIRHPLWTEAAPRQDIPILVLTLAQWERSQKEELAFGAAPVPPAELGRNRKFVFALPARYNVAEPQGFEEVEKIVESHPLRATR